MRVWNMRIAIAIYTHTLDVFYASQQFDTIYTCSIVGLFLWKLSQDFLPYRKEKSWNEQN